MKWLRRWLRDRPNEVFIVLDGGRVVGVSAVLQGADLIRVDEARRIVASTPGEPACGGDCCDLELLYDNVYDSLRVENADVQDCD